MEKTSGIVRGFDDLGRICVPKSIRHEAGLFENSFCEIIFDRRNNRIILQPMLNKQNCYEHIVASLDMLEEISNTMNDPEVDSIVAHLEDIKWQLHALNFHKED